MFIVSTLEAFFRAAVPPLCLEWRVGTGEEEQGGNAEETTSMPSLPAFISGRDRESKLLCTSLTFFIYSNPLSL